MNKSSPTDLYRHYDIDDNLLYIGISLRSLRRLRDHKSHSHWYSQIVKVTIQKFSNREDAIKAEAEAIKNEKPLHNIQHKHTSVERKRHRWEKTADELSRSIARFDPLYTIQDASQMLGLSVGYIRNEINQKRLSAVCLGERNVRGKLTKVLRITGWQIIDYLEFLESSSDGN